MFLPRYQMLSEFLRPSLNGPRQADAVPVPRAMFQLMLQLLLEHVPFDAEDYLRRNPDVRTALANGQISSARQHFVTKGYFEGRAGGYPIVDEAWYLKVNPDVAAEILKGTFASARDHYLAAGAAEWRSPSKEADETLGAWRKLVEAGADRSGEKAPAVADRGAASPLRRPG